MQYEVWLHGNIVQAKMAQGELFAETLANPDLACHAPVARRDQFVERWADIAKELGQVVG